MTKTKQYLPILILLMIIMPCASNSAVGLMIQTITRS